MRITREGTFTKLAVGRLAVIWTTGGGVLRVWAGRSVWRLGWKRLVIQVPELRAWVPVLRFTLDPS